MEIILGLIIAALGGILALRLKVPAGAMVGSMVAVAIFNITTSMAHFPMEAKVLTQILAGTFIGVRINKKVVFSLRSLVMPAILSNCFLILIGLGLGAILHAITKYDLTTVFLACSPGGITDMTLVAVDMDADVSTVTLLHLTRLIGVLCICPTLNKYMLRKFKFISNDCEIAATECDPDAQKKISLPTDKALNHQTSELEAIEISKEKQIIKANMVTISVGACGGMVGFFLPIPAGTLLFSMIAVAVFNTMGYKSYMSLPVKRSAQIVAGALVGQSFGMEQLCKLHNTILPAAVLVCSYIICNLLIAFLLNRICGLEMATALFATTPAGASDMALIASDVGADCPQVALLQVTRQMSVIGVYPLIVRFFVQLSS